MQAGVAEQAMVVIRLVVLLRAEVVHVLDNGSREHLALLRPQHAQPVPLSQQVAQVNDPRGRGMVIPGVLMRDRRIDPRVLLDPVLEQGGE